MLNFFKVLAVFLGTIIGVGIFGLPYVASKAGFFVVVLYLLLLGGITIAVQLIYSKICIGTKGTHRLPGYVEEYLGDNWKKIAILISGFGMTGASLAYLIVGGEFLKFLFAPYFEGSALIYTLLFFGAGAYLIFRGIKSISKIELSFLFIFFIILFLFLIKSLPFFDINHLKTMDWKFITFPYGVILFSLWGSAIIPELKEMLAGDKNQLRKVIISGVSIAALTYLFFVFIILGACGQGTSKEAMFGFSQALGDGIIGLGFVFGIITCFTSFITLGLTLKKTLWYDFGLPKNFSWLIACFLPLSLYLIGFKEFINVIGVTGALALGIEGIIIVFLYKNFLKKKFSRDINPLLYLFPLFFILGICLEIFYFMSM